MRTLTKGVNMRRHSVRTCMLLAGLGMLATAGQAQAKPREMLVIEGASASSTLYENGFDHSVYNLLDGDLTTDWAEGAEGGGFEEYVELVVAPGTQVTGVYVNPGFCKSRDLFYKNAAPTRLTFSSGGVSVDQWMSPYAADYDAACEGCYFNLTTPLTSDGKIRVTITGVREGTQYEDTCISGLELYGNGETGSSMVSPAPSSDITLPTGEVLTAHELWLQSYMAEAIARRKTDYPLDLTVSANDLSVNDRGFLLYWYQYNCEDSRITHVGNMNEVTYGNAVNILQEMFPDTANVDKDMSAFHTQYTTDFDGITYRMNAAGDFGDGGSWFLDEPTYEGVDGDQMILTGSVCQYNEATGDYDDIAFYQALFDVQSSGNGIHPFRQISIGVSNYDVINQS